MAAMSAPRTVLVTGASRGIGLEVCRSLASEPCTRVVVCARTAAAAAEAARNIACAGGVPPVPLQLDVSDAQSIDSCPQRLRDAGIATLNTLVNNAGVYETGWSRQSFDACVQTNFLGPVRLTLALLPMMAPGAATVVNVGSGLGELKWLQNSNYHKLVANANELAALERISFDPDDILGTFLSPGGRSLQVGCYMLSKAMLGRSTVLLAAQLSGGGVRVACVEPGWVRTDMGTQDAPRSVEQGASSVLRLVNAGEPWPNGKFISADGDELEW